MAVDPNLAALSREKRQKLESWLVEFDQSWDEGRLAAWLRRLPSPGDPLRLPALVEMIKIDMDRRWQKGERMRLESYLKSLPELGTPESVAADLVHAEYQVREQYGPRPDLSQFAKRFPRQLAALRQLVAGAEPRAIASAISRPKAETQRGRQSTPSLAQPTGAPELPEQFGRYRVVRCLGRGGMGAVYLAEDVELERAVALKVPHFSATDGEEILQRFYREAKAAATLSHPNLCPVYDVGAIDGIPYLTMAYLEGKPMSDHLASGKLLPQRHAALIVRKVALALEEAHARGVVHRDLKPSNIMINLRGEPVIMDFGLAWRADRQNTRLTQSGALLGTPADMAPEQVQGDLQAIGPACDVYSLGVILYELLTGRLPFEGPVMAALAQIVTQEPEPPSRYRQDLEPALDLICLKAMAKRPAGRYARMGELDAALTEYLRTSSTQTPASPSSHSPTGQDQLPESVRVTVPERGKACRPTRRIPWWLWIAAGGAATALILGIVIIIRTKHGTIKIETDDPNATVEIKQPGQVSNDGEGPGTQARHERKLNDADKTRSTPGNPVDLLALIDPKKHAVAGADWKKIQGVLISPAGENRRVQVPYSPPEEYRLEVVVERTGECESLALGLVIGTSQVAVQLDSKDKTGAGRPIGSGIGMIDGKGFGDNETTRPGVVLRNGVPSTIVVTVRKNSIHVTCDDETIINWHGDPSRLALNQGWIVPDKRALFLGSWTSYHISKMTLYRFSKDPQ